MSLIAYPRSARKRADGSARTRSVGAVSLRCPLFIEVPMSYMKFVDRSPSRCLFLREDRRISSKFGRIVPTRAPRCLAVKTLQGSRSRRRIGTWQNIARAFSIHSRRDLAARLSSTISKKRVSSKFFAGHERPSLTHSAPY
jgi:hypothetical protein